MKYYQILYNSSQSSKDGGVGFGIRAMSEDLPQEYIAPITELKIFSDYESGNCPAPRSGELFNEPQKILAMPMNYSYFMLDIAESKTIYILKRCIPLGFDYGYYSSGKATRLGNYSIHLFIFEQKPDSMVFDLMYELPSTNSAYFRPKERVPNPECDELKDLMVGKMSPLEATSNLVVNTTYSEPICEAAYNVLFNYVEVLKQGKKSLVVKIIDSQKSVVIGDFYRLLGAYAPQITFIAGVYSQSINTNINISFVNEYNPESITEESEAYIYCDSAVAPNSEEYKIYYPQLIESANRNDKVAMLKITAWLLSGDYKLVAGKKPQTSSGFFNYCHNQELFTIKELLNTELIDTIAGRTPKQDKLLKNRFVEGLKRAIVDENNKALCEIMKSLHYAKRKSVDITSILSDCRQMCCDYILEGASQVVIIYENVGREIFELFVVQESFIAKENYIGSAELRPKIKDLYRYFVAKPSASLGLLISKLVNNIEAKLLTEILRDANPNIVDRANTYTKFIDQNPEFVTKLWKLVMADNGAASEIDVYKEFEKHRSNDKFAPLLYHQLQNGSYQASSIISFNRQLMELNSAYRGIVLGGESKNRVYTNIFSRLLNEITQKNGVDISNLIKESIIPYREIYAGANWSSLYSLLNGEYNNLPKQFDLAKQIKDKSYLIVIAYKYLDSEMSRSTIADIISSLNGAGCFDAKEYMMYVAKYDTKKQTYCIGEYCMLKKLSFSSAQTLLERLTFYTSIEVLSKYYTREYESMLKKQKVVGFFKNLFNFSKSDKVDSVERNSRESSSRSNGRNSKNIKSKKRK